jgi:hypothetical protein
MLLSLARVRASYSQIISSTIVSSTMLALAEDKVLLKVLGELWYLINRYCDIFLTPMPPQMQPVFGASPRNRLVRWDLICYVTQQTL